MRRRARVQRASSDGVSLIGSEARVDEHGENHRHGGRCESQAPRRELAHTPARPDNHRGGVRGADARERRRGRVGQVRAQERAQLGARVGDRDQAERRHRRVVHADVPCRGAERDHRAAAAQRLQRRHAAGRVDQDISGAHELVHARREAEHGDALVAHETLGQRPLRRVIAPRDRDDCLRAAVQRRSHTALEVPHAPAATADHHHRPLRGKVERPACDDRVSDRAEAPRYERLDEHGTAHAGHALDRPDGMLMHHKVHIGAAMRPDLIVGHVGDGHDERHRQPPAPPRATQDAGERGMGRDHDVGLDVGDQRQQPAPAEAAEHHLAHAAADGNAVEQGVHQRVGPRREPQLHPVAVTDDVPRRPAERDEAVALDHFGVVLLEPLGDGAGGREVALADVRRKHQDPEHRMPMVRARP